MSSTAEQEKKQKEKLKEIRTLLASGEEDKVLEGVREAREHGDERIIQPLIETWTKGHGDPVDQEITQIFYDLKNSSSLEPLIEGLDHPELEEDRSSLLAVFWNSRLDPSGYIDKFVDIAVHGSFLECFEAVTVIEEMEGPFEEDRIMESLLIVNNYFSDYTDEKEAMIKDILKRLKQIEDNL